MNLKWTPWKVKNTWKAAFPSSRFFELNSSFFLGHSVLKDQIYLDKKLSKELKLSSNQDVYFRDRYDPYLMQSRMPSMLKDRGTPAVKTALALSSGVMRLAWNSGTNLLVCLWTQDRTVGSSAAMVKDYATGSFLKGISFKENTK